MKWGGSTTATNKCGLCLPKIALAPQTKYCPTLSPSLEAKAPETTAKGA
jgi:hypothetical protein